MTNPVLAPIKQPFFLARWLLSSGCCPSSPPGDCQAIVCTEEISFTQNDFNVVLSQDWLSLVCGRPLCMSNHLALLCSEAACGQTDGDSLDQILRRLSKVWLASPQPKMWSLNHSSARILELISPSYEFDPHCWYQAWHDPSINIIDQSTAPCADLVK